MSFLALRLKAESEVRKLRRRTPIYIPDSALLSILIQPNKMSPKEESVIVEHTDVLKINNKTYYVTFAKHGTIECRNIQDASDILLIIDFKKSTMPDRGYENTSATAPNNI